MDSLFTSTLATISAFKFDNRHPVTLGEWLPTMGVHLLMAVLVTRPGTRLARLALLPIEVFLSGRAVLLWDMASGDPEKVVFHIFGWVRAFLV